MPDSTSAPRLEISAFSLHSALAARSGAHRIELCSGSKASGGFTPTISELGALADATTQPIYVMLRPTEHTFAYAEHEFQEMKDMLAAVQTLRRRKWPEGQCLAAGFVFGILLPNGAVDVPRCRELVDLAHAGGQSCTFHRAFDEIRDRREGLEDLVTCGFDGVLTAGGPGSVVDNVRGLAETIALAGERIEIVAGGGVRSANLCELRKKFGHEPDWWHSAAMVGEDVEASAGEVVRLRQIVDGED